MEKVVFCGDIPEARFGHTVTQVSSTKVVLYGGATGANGKFAITSETYLLDMITRKWRKLDPQGVCPNERAAHAATAVESLQVLLFGGATGGGGLANEDLYLLDLKSGEEKANWLVIPTIGNSPGRRYGHSMVYLKPFTVVFGGVPGNDPTNDVFILNLERSPFSWVRIDYCKEAPPPRVYHTASLCNFGSTKGMILIFGGRGADQAALNDTWGFRKHRNGRWDWVQAAYKTEGQIPTPRFQHAALFVNSLMLVIGGRSNSITDIVPIDIFDVEASCWFKVAGIARFRQANWLFEGLLYTHGGLDQTSPNEPLQEFLKLDLSNMLQDTEHLLKIAASQGEVYNLPGETNIIKYGPGCGYYNTVINPSTKSPLGKKNSAEQNCVYLSKKAYVGSSYQPYSTEFNSQIRKISIIKLQEESKKIGTNTNSMSSIKTFKAKNNDEIADFFLDQLLIENFSFDLKISFDKTYLGKLVDETEKIIQREPTLLRLKSPIKIFGNLHGQLGDLLEFFWRYGTPSDSVLHGDIDGFSYLFLGDYIDKGLYSLETLVLLFCFKVKHPDSFFLLRGHHEDIFVNKLFGFAEECTEKLEENIEDPQSFYQKINKLFEYLPLAAVIDNQILCLHGGIGNTLKSVEDIEKLERPIEISHKPVNNYEKIVVDILLSDPVDDDGVLESQPNPNRDYLQFKYISKFTSERVMEFLKFNKLKTLIRSHECVLHGFENFSLNSLITVYSAMSYIEKNAACILVIKKNLEIARKALFPDENKKEEKWQKSWGTKAGLKFSESEMKIRKKERTPPRNKDFKTERKR